HTCFPFLYRTKLLFRKESGNPGRSQWFTSGHQYDQAQTVRFTRKARNRIDHLQSRFRVSQTTGSGPHSRKTDGIVLQAVPSSEPPWWHEELSFSKSAPQGSSS